MNKNFKYLFPIFFFFSSCITWATRDQDSVPMPKNLSEIMKPITFIVQAQLPPLDMEPVNRFHVLQRYSNTIASCRCLSDYNLFLNELPSKDEKFEYIALVKLNAEPAADTFNKTITVISMFTLTVLPFWDKENYEYTAILFDKNGKELKSFSGSGSHKLFGQLLLFPTLFTKHSNLNRSGPLTWIAEDIFQSGLVPKIPYE